MQQTLPQAPRATSIGSKVAPEPPDGQADALKIGFITLEHGHATLKVSDTVGKARAEPQRIAVAKRRHARRRPRNATPGIVHDAGSLSAPTRG